MSDEMRLNGRFLRVSVSLIVLALMGLLASHMTAIAELREWRRLTEQRIDRIEVKLWPTQ